MFTLLLAYTLNRLMEKQRALIVRDQGTIDKWGAESAPDWQALSTVRCLFWFWRESARGPAKLFATPQREVAQSEGGMILPHGTDITERDRVSQVTDASGGVEVYGPFDIVAVFSEPDHIQVAWKRATEARVVA